MKQFYESRDTSLFCLIDKKKTLVYLCFITKEQLLYFLRHIIMTDLHFLYVQLLRSI